MPDVVVLGAGLAGLTAALRARATARSVLVIDPTPEGRGANSRISGGVFHLAWGALDEDPLELVRRMIDQTDGEVDLELARALALAGGRAISWLVEQGVHLGPKGSRPHDKFTCLPWLEARGAESLPERGAEIALATLRDRARRSGVEFVAGAADRMQRRPDGWQIRIAGAQPVFGRTIVVATGGFQADPQLMRALVGPHADDVFLRSTDSATGGGLRLLIGAGAALTEPSSAVYGHLLSASALTEPMLWPQPTVDAVALRGGLLVDRDGHAFTPEVDNGIALVNAMVRTGDPSGYTVVFDSGVYAGASAERGATQTDGHLRDVSELVERGAEIVEAPTVAELAVRLRIPRVQLRKSMDAWKPGATGPWYAMRVLPGVTATMRGVRVDAGCRVLASDGAVLPGLLAAGDVVGVHGGPRGGYLGGLAVALISGYIAGAS